MKTIDFHQSALTARDGTRLFLRRAGLGKNVRAQVLVIHGMGEHSSRYLHVAERLVSHDFGVSLFDLRGHGRSEGRRGHIESYAQLLEDIALVAAEVSRESGPVFIYGHSLGGQLAINFVAEHRSPAAGLIAASPWLDLAFAPKVWKVMLARVLVRLWPGFTQATQVRPERLSRDQEFLASLSDLDLVHHRMSARMYFELTAGAARARAGADKIDLPLLLLHGESDPITSAAATRDFFKNVRASDKTIRLYPDTLHETHNDLARETVLRDVVDWLEARC